MHTFYNLFGLTLPSYGSCIALGVILSLLMILLIMKKNGDSIDDFLLMLAYALIGALAGSKGLFLIISHNEIQWDRLFDLSYLNLVLTQGFVFYGGLVGGLVMAFLSGKFHKFNSLYYIRKYHIRDQVFLASLLTLNMILQHYFYLSCYILQANNHNTIVYFIHQVYL